MSRRSGQSGTLVKQTGWWRVRFRLDQPGGERRHMSVKVAPASMGLTKPELERRAKEIVQNAGANSEERFNRVVLGEVTFREQAKIYLQTAVSRKRNPLRDTVSIEGAMNKWIYPAIGDLPLAYVDNLTVKPLVEKMSAASLSPRTVNKYVEYIKQVVKSLKAPNGEPVHKRTWDAETMDLPIVNHSEQKRPSLKAKAISKLITDSTGQEQELFVLLAATGMRISEALGLEVRHIVNDGRTIGVEQQVKKDQRWPYHRGRAAGQKGPSSNREVSQDRCLKERNRPAPGCCRVPATIYSRKIWTAVSDSKRYTTSLQQAGRSLAHATARQHGIGREGDGLALIQAFS